LVEKISGGLAIQGYVNCSQYSPWQECIL
jgi:hypothetical protein